MSLDGSLSSLYVDGGRRMAPVTQQFASETLPPFVFWLNKNQLQVSRMADSLGHVIVWMQNGIQIEQKCALLEADFIIVKNLADTMIIPLYPQEPYSDILARIRAQLQVLFQGRSAF